MNKNRISLFLKGMAMGAADVVPGVSGGTIAFITNIYDELIDTISSISISTFKLLFTEGIASFWKKINGAFLLTLVAGIAVSVFSLANIVGWLLINHTILLWSFFFGLVLASVFFVGKSVGKWTWQTILSLLVGTAIAFYLTILPPMGNSSEMWFIFISGMIAICAMILPGISGSFILLILGSFQTIISAIKNLDITTIAVFGTGCIIGLLSFSRVLKWMFTRFHDLTIALLTGFLIGSLNKLWPWKENVKELYTHSDGRVEYYQINTCPCNFDDSKIVLAVVCAISGALIIYGIEYISRRLSKR